jgi:hypothetical protein
VRVREGCTRGRPMRSRTAIRGDTAATQAQQPRDSTKISVSPITATSIAKCSLFGQGLFDLCEATGSATPALRSLRISLRGGNRQESPTAPVPHRTPIEWKPPESTFVDSLSRRYALSARAPECARRHVSSLLPRFSLCRTCIAPPAAGHYVVTYSCIFAGRWRRAPDGKGSPAPAAEVSG